MTGFGHVAEVSGSALTVCNLVGLEIGVSTGGLGMMENIDYLEICRSLDGPGMSGSEGGTGMDTSMDGLGMGASMVGSGRGAIISVSQS